MVYAERLIRSSHRGTARRLGNGGMVSWGCAPIGLTTGGDHLREVAHFTVRYESRFRVGFLRFLGIAISH